MTLKRKKSFGLVGLVVILAVLGIASASYFLYQSNSGRNDPISDTEASTEQLGSNPEEKRATARVIITTGESEFGTMLFNDKKQAIYIWELEESSKAECYDDCAEAWPPVLTNGEPQAAGAVKSDLLGTTQRADGSTQVTYNGHPLYYYAHEGAGEVKCHNISTHGGLWWVIQPNGNRAE